MNAALVVVYNVLVSVRVYGCQKLQMMGEMQSPSTALTPLSKHHHGVLA